MADMNGDGLNDLVHGSKIDVCTAGKGTSGYSKYCIKYSRNCESIHNTDKVQFADLNHDGLADLVYFNGFKVTVWPKYQRPIRA